MGEGREITTSGQALPTASPPRTAAEVLADLAAAVDAAVAEHAARTAGAPREVRALTIFDVVPAGHVAVPVTDDGWSPHLRPGEFAVLDPSDVEPQRGELYGIMIEARRPPGVRTLRIVQARRSVFSGSDAVVFGFGERRPGVTYIVDGPLGLDAWRRACRGRVVGVLVPTGGEARHDGL